jgi:hypothetical protein
MQDLHRLFDLKEGGRAAAPRESVHLAPGTCSRSDKVMRVFDWDARGKEGSRGTWGFTPLVPWAAVPGGAGGGSSGMLAPGGDFVPACSTHQVRQVKASLIFTRLAGWADGLVVEATPETTAPACPTVGFDRGRRYPERG